MSSPFFTIGHSDRSFDEFLGLLRKAEVELVVDVRKIPGSSTHPQYNQDELATSLGEAGIAYLHSTGLTGRRPVSQTVPKEVNAWWTNQSFHNYADHALSEEFRTALDQLRDTGRGRRLAVMCAEALWWRCHRRIIADHLLGRGEEVLHIVGGGRPEHAVFSAGAEVEDDGSVRYPAQPPE